MTKGFSLIEISVVIVVIGFLAAAVVVGNNLLRASEVRKVIKQIDQYNVAIRTFEDTYNQKPGDFNNAIAYLGATKNGDGNGIIADRPGNMTLYPSQLADISGSNELNGVFEHLYLGEFIGDSIDADTSGELFIGRNLPALKGTKLNAGMLVLTDFNDREVKLIFGVVANGATDNQFLAETIYGPKNALDIDNKIDDGVANQGIVRGDLIYGTNAAAHIGSSDCAIDSTGYSVYNTDLTGVTDSSPCHIHVFLR